MFHRKKMYRGAVVATVAATVALTLSACTSSQTTPTAGSTSAFVGSSAENYYMVTFLSGYPYWKDAYRGFEDAAKQLGVTPHYAGTTEYDVNAAVAAFEQVIATKPDGLAVTAMDADAYVDPINSAVDAGIPTVTFDSDSPDSDRSAFLGTGNYEAGAEVARQLGALYDSSEKVKVGVVTVLGQTNINDRVSGFQETLAADFPNITVVDVVDAGADETTASAAAANLLKANPDLNAVFATIVTAEVGTLTAVREAGNSGKIKVATFDADEVTLKNIESGDVAFTVAQGPYNQGYWAMMMLYAEKHQTVTPVQDWAKYGIAALPPSVDTGAFVIDSDNVAPFLSALGD